MAAKIPKATIAKIEQVTGLTVKRAEKEDFAPYDGFLYYKDECRHVIEVKNRKGKYTLNLLEKKGTILIDTAKIEKLSLISYLHNIAATLFIETSDGHLIVFKLTNKKGKYIMPVDDQRDEMQPTHEDSERKEIEHLTHLNIDYSKIYEFKE